MNAATSKDYYPMLLIQAKIDKLCGCLFITKFDLVNGYWQIGMRKKARELTAFKSHEGIYELVLYRF